MADENTMPEIPDDINLDDDEDAYDEDGNESSGKKAKISFNFASPKLIKILIWVGIGSVVIIAEVVIAYMLINKFFIEKQMEQFEQNQPVQVQAAATGEEASPIPTNVDLPALNDEPAPDMKSVGAVYTFADVVVNPAMSQGKRYFVVSIVCTFEDKKMADKITLLEPVAQDRLNTLLSSKTTQWYNTYTNRTLLKREVMAVIMQILDIKDGMNIYFTKYVIQ